MAKVAKKRPVCGGKEKVFKWDDARNALVEVKGKQRKRRPAQSASLNLQCFLETLPAADAKPPVVVKRHTPAISAKSKLRLELEHFGRVLAHPAFKQDPVSAITAHIVNKHEPFTSINK